MIMNVPCREAAPGILVGNAGMELDWADLDWLGIEPLKEESAEALGAELGLPSASLGFFFVRDAHLFLTALSVLQQGSSRLAIQYVCLLKHLAWQHKAWSNLLSVVASTLQGCVLCSVLIAQLQHRKWCKHETCMAAVYTSRQLS